LAGQTEESLIYPGIGPKESGIFYSGLLDLRQTGDYDDLFHLTEEDVKPLKYSAEKYIDELLNLID
jgi:uncharacterized protein (UPF0332 family)